MIRGIQCGSGSARPGASCPGEGRPGVGKQTAFGSGLHQSPPHPGNRHASAPHHGAGRPGGLFAGFRRSGASGTGAAGKSGLAAGAGGAGRGEFRGRLFGRKPHLRQMRRQRLCWLHHVRVPERAVPSGAEKGNFRAVQQPGDLQPILPGLLSRRR